MQSNRNTGPRVVVLGMGGTIAGVADDSAGVGYRAAQIGVAQLVAAVPALALMSLETEQVAQIDSKDMTFALWQQLAARCAHHLARTEVAGVVVTHGTDTLEETAYFLHRVLAPRKPLVLTAAMRPATALLADGPQNLLDAVTLARSEHAMGVLVLLAGQVHGAPDVRKAHPYRLDAFDSGDAGVLAHIEQGRLRVHRPWPVGQALGLARIQDDPADWPWVEIVTSGVGARAAVVAALVAQGVAGIVVAGTGNGSLHQDLERALRAAQRSGVPVRRVSRCAQGALVGIDTTALPAAGRGLSAVQARIELLLELLGCP